MIDLKVGGVERGVRGTRILVERAMRVTTKRSLWELSLT